MATVILGDPGAVSQARLCIKVGRGQARGRGHRDACVGTWDLGLGTWDLGLGTWGSETRELGKRDEGLEDIKYGTRGRVKRGRGDVKYRNAGDTNYYRKSRR